MLTADVVDTALHAATNEEHRSNGERNSQHQQQDHHGCLVYALRTDLSSPPSLTCTFDTFEPGRSGTFAQVSSSSVIELRFDCDPTTPRNVRRRIVREFGDAIDDGFLLCLSEVVTNAILHAGTSIVVYAAQVDGVVRVEVSDGSVLPPSRREVDPDSPTGRGLLLLDTLATAWGVDVRPDGKTVWFETAVRGNGHRDG